MRFFGRLSCIAFPAVATIGLSLSNPPIQVQTVGTVRRVE